MTSSIQKRDNGIRLNIYVQPGASRDEFAGTYEDALKLRISAPAREGAANEAICAFLSKFFAVSKSSVSILKGQSSRKKTVFVKGDSEDFADRLNILMRNLKS